MTEGARPDGLGIAVVYFTDESANRAWKNGNHSILARSASAKRGGIPTMS
jgi:hypothetical protein